MKKTRIFVSGLIVGLLLTTGVFATNEKIQATFANFNFMVNSQKAEIKSKPIVYNGTSYLPVGDISRLLGYNVDYIDKTRTIVLNDKKQSNINYGQIPLAPKANRVYNIDEEFNLDDKTTIRVTKVEYKDEFNNRKASSEDETLIVVYFDIYTSLEPKDGFKWHGLSFTNSIIVEDKVLRVGSMGEFDFHPNVKSTSSFLAEAPKDKKPTLINFRSHITGETVGVKID